MTWIGEHVRDEATRRAYGEVERLAEWSPWLSWDDGLAEAPRAPGVYLLRERATHLVRYAGRAGDRAGGGRPQGLHGRLLAYRTGHEPVGGFAEAALDLALADPEWLHEQVARGRAGNPRRARRWAAEAMGRLAPELSWTTCGEAAEARLLETEVVALLRPYDLWNR